MGILTKRAGSSGSVSGSSSGDSPPSMAFASFPAASSVPGQRLRASDLAYAELYAQGGEWWPSGGEQTIALSVVPVINLPSGTIDASGAIVLQTALVSTARVCWGFLPAGAVSGGSAGYYYAEFTSTTVGHVYTNFNDASGDFFPGIPTGTLTPAVGSGAAYVGNTAQVPMFKKTVPGGLMASKTLIRIAPAVAVNSNANSKTMYVTLGGSQATNPPLTSLTGRINSWILVNLGKGNTQRTAGWNGETDTSGAFAIFATLNIASPHLAAIDTAKTVATDWTGLFGCALTLSGAP